ncbi:MAG: peptidoglycan DD-metalloendopeptidase family protein, partial [bacterium]
MRIKLFFLFAIVCVSTLFVSCGSGKTNQEKSEEAQDTIVVPQRDIKYGVDITDLTVQSGKVKSNQVISSLFNELGAPKSVINQLSLIPDTVFDVRLLKAGNSYEAFYTADSLPQLQYLVYMDTKIKCVVFHVQDSFYVERFNKPVLTQTKVSEVTIESSLWNAIVDANLNIELAVKLSDIYAWTVDFFGLQKGDGFKVYYDESYVDSSSVGISAIHASVFRHNDKNVYAIEYEKDGRSAYWDLEGNSVKKAFLKAPLSFSRISSGFTYARKHPVYKTVRPHTGVDYAAPMGTPVMSIGDGVVISKGYQGGGGNTVKIKHNSTYTTAYL